MNWRRKLQPTPVLPWTEEAGGATVHGVAKSWTQLNTCRHA